MRGWFEESRKMWMPWILKGSQGVNDESVNAFVPFEIAWCRIAADDDTVVVSCSLVVVVAVAADDVGSTLV
jgi:hypothetical protein